MLKARVITALFLVAGLSAVLFALPASFATFAFALIAAIAGWEWAGLTGLSGKGRMAYGALVLLLCGLAHAMALDVPLWVASAGFWLLLVPFWLKHRWPLARGGAASWGIGLLLTVPTWAAMVALHQRGPWVLIGVMALVWVADIAAYFAGRAFGRHKLAPAISPGKTWEGVGGAIAGTAVYGGTLLATVGIPLLPLALPGILLLTAVSIVGDLFESLAKRQAGIKDSSNLLPGHGGVLDRIDSLTSALPLAALLLKGSGL